MIEIRRSFAVLAFDGWIVLACALILSIARVQTVAAADLQPQLSRCRTDSECRKGFKCYVQVPGIGLEGACVPRGPSGPDDDEQVCLHKANCAAAAALRRVCPGCIITPIMTCGGVPASDAWYRERWERLKDCLSPTPEQIRAAVPVARTSSPRPHRVKEIQEGPDLNDNVNQWNIQVPAAWAVSVNKDSLEKLNRHKGRLENTLNRLWEFNAACPINEEDIRSRTTTSRLIAGTCGGFRNPDPTKPPPSLMYPRTP
jgi:hypothetical protein